MALAIAALGSAEPIEIENAEVARRLADFGCDVGRGFFFSAPVPADEALRLLHDTRRIPDHSAGV